MKILLIDDSHTQRQVQKDILAELDYHDILEAENGEEGLKKLDKNQVDLILLDWNMPEMDGLTCLKKIRANKATEKVHVIMITSESNSELGFEALTAGANNFITKPYTKELFTSTVKGAATN